ncbi:MaoC family dehydratase [uncultured Xylophilus sp.]|uniref:MaoC family dehydratase n=1 Tax=uncultured Xylophilus sp. TaxID=296832 RepID=UPI0025D322CA|nr:MaoC family dehydratase [uncultured Xylophilus sp.]
MTIQRKEVETIDDLPALVGQPLGTSGWITIGQSMIDDFARISGDHNWIHVDVERARRELPEGRTIVHGMLTLSLVAQLGSEVFGVRQRDRGINYGSNKVRFITPVLCGARIRLHRTLAAVDPMDGGRAARVTFDNTVEIDGEARPAMVAETITVIYGKRAA